MIDISTIFQFLMHIDDSLVQLVQNYGFISYLILFLVIFFETGVVITPFLPGDSLLFATGAIAAIGEFNVFFLMFILILAAFLGDNLNYFVGIKWGRKIVDYAHRKNFIINYNHIQATEEFYHKYGGKAIILARFMPIVRTFAPFVAGIAKMDYHKFITRNLFGGILWVLLFVLGGFFFGNIPLVKENFEIVIIAIIILSFVPPVIEYLRKKN